MLPDSVNYVLLAEDFWIFLATTCQTMVDVRSVLPVLTCELTSWTYPANNSCLQALTKDISTPADIVPSALETIVFYCFMGYRAYKCTDLLSLLLWLITYDIIVAGRSQARFDSILCELHHWICVLLTTDYRLIGKIIWEQLCSIFAQWIDGYTGKVERCSAEVNVCPVFRLPWLGATA